MLTEGRCLEARGHIRRSAITEFALAQLGSHVIGLISTRVLLDPRKGTK
jgi:hypothetical protein